MVLIEAWGERYLELSEERMEGGGRRVSNKGGAERENKKEGLVARLGGEEEKER